MNAGDLIAIADVQLNAARRMAALVQRSECLVNFVAMPAAEQEMVAELVRTSNCDKLREWIHSRGLDCMTHRQLRDLAAKHGVPGYSRLLKYELIAILEELLNHEKQAPVDSATV